MREPIVVTYLIYLALSIALTVWVARTLHRNGKVFLVDVFGGNEDLASSVNHLLVVGFYLVNLGFISLTLRTSLQVLGARDSIELLSSKVGMVLVVLGCMHLFNVYVFNSFRRRSMELARHGTRPPPLPPSSPGWRDPSLSRS
ncbi:MAG TPA: hypothetical protein VK843_21240 [Planctomycetota bacterium]|nr:hypothetical protein [Planctomycetota bacterium]